ncbi:hypothetical protein ACHWQZ_G002908 [Mnemiopsis leidyi]
MPMESYTTTISKSTELSIRAQLEDIHTVFFSFSATSSYFKPSKKCQTLVLISETSRDPDIVLDEVRELARNHKHWREMIRHKRQFLGAGHSKD